MNINVVNEDEVIIDGVTYKKEVKEETIKEEVNEKEPKFKKGQTVYSILTNPDVNNESNTVGYIMLYNFDPEYPANQFNLSIGNVFETEEEAKAAIEKLKQLNKFNEKFDAIKESTNNSINDLSEFMNKSLDKLFSTFKDEK